eukprot:m.86370 g.86370  ORF g.86370 m.86370 type:complete len:346 (+) comp14873_c2_seq2:187-1224(+)
MGLESDSVAVAVVNDDDAMMMAATMDVVELGTAVEQEKAKVHGMLDFLALLHDENTRREAENQPLERAVREHEHQALLNQQQLLQAEHPTLLRHHVGLLQRHKLCVTRNAELLQRIQALQNQLIKKQGAQVKVLELQRAREAQQAFRRTVRATLNDGAFFKAACKRQERGVRQLEQLAKQAAQARGTKQQRPAAAPGDELISSPPFVLTPLPFKLEAENRRLQEDIAALADEDLCDPEAEHLKHLVAQEKQLTEQLEQELRMPSQASRSTDKDGETKLASLEKLAAQLEDELMATTMQNAREIKHLELRAMEQRIKHAGGFGAAATLPLGAIPKAEKRVSWEDNQ